MGKRVLDLLLRLWPKVEPLWNTLARFFSSKPVTVAISIAVGLFVVAIITFVSYGKFFPVLDTAGTIADQQRDLIYITVLLSIVVVVPVFALLFGIAWKYRAGNKKALYDPEYDHNGKLEIIWWGIPFIIIIILSVITFISTHALDPYKPLESSKEPVTIQVISLQWKWLFIYPEQEIATVNYMNIPKDTPINLELTSDAPMNSFWVPALAGQVYSMTGMSTKLHLEGNEIGSYRGSSANISGDGYADMDFQVHVQSEADFDRWATQARNSPTMLETSDYDALAQPSKNLPDTTYMLMVKDLYDKIVMKYMNAGDEAIPLGLPESTEAAIENDDMTHTDMGMPWMDK